MPDLSVRLGHDFMYKLERVCEETGFSKSNFIKQSILDIAKPKRQGNNLYLKLNKKESQILEEKCKILAVTKTEYIKQIILDGWHRFVFEANLPEEEDPGPPIFFDN
jgi:hypothetical protein